jgi:hypothetical protein
MVGIRVIHLREIRPPSPLHWPWIKDRRVGDIVALIDATLARARRVSANFRRSLPRRSLQRLLRQAGAPPFLQPSVQRPVNSRRAITHPNSAHFSSFGERRWSAGKAAGGSASPGSVTT